ncbi:hypothetical protein M3P05_10865 [Sansalvadorimonas sp. 2012CJ34-2]|uniref:Uncharacterized protein n=1 Tax=Parendozoicomonas callyspongiae TaxID=2942213 RepID=A0ABT0PGQ4_9GAMM|nr:hypothetical protein [Sansalvadorimonas sp. 2012CJ34-2]MCL6270421.1 hypothetical protein [Sansalvadorimonas sp. 2012CJ34-2]
MYVRFNDGNKINTSTAISFGEHCLEDNRSCLSRIRSGYFCEKCCIVKNISERICRTIKSNAKFVCRFVDRRLKAIGEYNEAGARQLKSLPHYKYCIRPLYKALSLRVGRPIATVCTFLAADILFHGLPSKLIYYLNHGRISLNALDFITLPIWGPVGFTVAYAKYMRTRNMTS